MRVVHASFSDSRGGAARAAYRVHSALRAAGVDSLLVVDHQATNDTTVHGPSRLERGRSRAASLMNRTITKVQRAADPVLRSPALFSAGAASRIRNLSPDIVTLHWITGSLLTVRDVGQIETPIVWRLPDMWAFCGAEHYAPVNGSSRWLQGYSTANRPAEHAGLDLDLLTWKLKRRYWNQAFHIVAPSAWLADQVRASSLLGHHSVTVIPNPLDTDVFAPRDPQQARKLLGIPQNVPIVLFGAVGGTGNPIKGFDLLKAALQYVAVDHPDAELVVFGEPARPPEGISVPTHTLGVISDDLLLSHVYSAADVMVVPSRMEAFGQTASEAIACGTPVVGFDTTGLATVIDHLRSGYLSRYLDSEDLARGISWGITSATSPAMRETIRAHAVVNWSFDAISPQYLAVYDSVLRRNK